MIVPLTVIPMDPFGVPVGWNSTVPKFARREPAIVIDDDAGADEPATDGAVSNICPAEEACCPAIFKVAEEATVILPVPVPTPESNEICPAASAP